MQEEFIPYEESLSIKKLGFDDPCYSVYGYNMEDYKENGMYKRLVSLEEIKFTEGNFEIKKESLKNSLIGDNGICAPTFREFFGWIRRNYSIFPLIIVNGDREFRFTTTIIGEGVTEENSPSGRYNSYEECELECVRHCISLISNDI